MLKTPPLQTATATIDTLCGRLQSATLLEDRRGAILGLRSFAKQYPASVASGSLRELIGILRRDGLGNARSTKSALDGESRSSEEGGDVDTIRLVLETLLMLFNPDSSSPEASDEIAFFMADEFSMRQDNISLLLSLLDPASAFADYYSRLYSVQLLQAICSARPERLQECILNAPLGVSRLVGILDDTRDAVRSAGLLLLVELTSGANEELRKIVAFEDVFGKIFATIQAEGGLGEAGVVAQDCLSLLNNLIRGSASNQTMFRESGCVTQMARLLGEAFPPAETESQYSQQGRERAAWGLLQLLGSFMEPGEKSTPQNQHAFFRVGTAQILIDLGFCADLPAPIRTLALKGAIALIASNAPLQEAFAALTVEVPTEADVESKPAGHVNGARSAPHSNKGSARPSVERPRTYVIEALLDLTLSHELDNASLRTAGCNLIQAYLKGHPRIKEHFINRAIDGHAHHEEAANVLNTLLHPGADPSSVVYASWIVSDLVADQPDAKTALAAIKEGDESEGEDVLTAIQALGSQLNSALPAADVRLVSAYSNLLTVLLWDFADGVNHLLAEGSSLLQSLVAATDPASSDPTIAGLSATILGTVYEFSTKDSPIPRRTLAPLITQKLGRSKYLEALTQLRRHPVIRDFDLDEVTDDILLSNTFVDLFMLEYARLRKAIDKDPGIEVMPFATAEAGVDRDILDDLRQQIQATKDALAQAQEEALATSQEHEQTRLTVAKDLQTSTAEVERLRKINQAMQTGHEFELDKLAGQHEQSKQQINAAHAEMLASLKHESEVQIQTRLREQGAASAQKAQEYERRIVELGNTHRSEQQKHTETAQQLEQLTAKHAELGSKEQSNRQQLEELRQKHAKMDKEHQQLSTRAEQAEIELEKMKSESEKRQELNTRLLAQVKELRDELKGREEELKTERAGYGDLEKELESAKATIKTAEQDLAAAEKRAKDADSKVKAAEEKAATAAKSSGKGKGKVDTEKVSQLEKEVQEAKEGEKGAKEELESMLLLMGDLESKRDEYKAKVKELGGSVTDDEEGGDSEDEEEDEDGQDDVD